MLNIRDTTLRNLRPATGSPVTARGDARHRDALSHRERHEINTLGCIKRGGGKICPFRIAAQHLFRFARRAG
ncbi:hypothetical protein LC092_15010 [Stappia stellulata]|uniref:hypothetical protein n=1 Tax=Stappia stellulata TaxID=71235 RepID=UPI001CD2E848|nr:hypothetical protein [Stappia stellulata]MCA1243758.1 hypothetical protein [Stappia stellulata]